MPYTPSAAPYRRLSVPRRYHLTRTFHHSFGMAPSVLMRGAFLEIASPFTAASAASGRRPPPE